MTDPEKDTKASGHYYDGQTARAHAVDLRVNIHGELTLSPALRPPSPFAACKISSRVGSTPRRIEFSDGALFESRDHSTIDQWLDEWSRSSRWIHHLESKTSFALGALFLVLVFIGISVTWGIPWSSKYIAQMMPASVTVPLGDSAVESLDKLVFYPSKLSTQRQSELGTQFEKLLPSDDGGYEYQLLFRGGGNIGPNAFALPNGSIIITDELVALADFDEELQAILLHEIGHLQYHHSLRQIIAHTSLAVLTTTLTGDITAASTLISGAPNVLMEASFSREMETEADSYSLQQMQQLGLDTEHFANIMERLEFAAFDDEDHEQTREKEGGRDGEPSDNEASDNESAENKNDASWFDTTEALDYFSSHPLTADRVARFRHGKPAPLPLPTAITEGNHYPVDAKALRAQLAAGQYAELDQLFDSYYQDFLAGNHRAEIIAEKSYDLLTALSPQTLEQLQQWAAAMPESYTAHHALGVYHANQITRRRSGRLWRNIPEEDLAAMTEHTDSAVASLRRSLTLKANFTLAQAELYSLASAGNAKDIDAEQVLAEALSANPTSYILNRTQLFYLQPRWGGDYRDMRRTLQTIADLAELNPELAPLAGSFHHYKAFDAYLEDDYRRSVKLESLAIQQGHKSWFFSRRAKAYKSLGDMQAALTDYNNALRLFPENAQLHVERSKIFAALQQAAEARKDIDIALALAPYNTDALYQLASLQRRANKNLAALQSYQKILTAEPTKAYAHFMIGWVQFNRLNQPDAALQATQKALDYRADWPPYWYQYAQISSFKKSCDFMSAASTYLQLCEEKSCPQKRMDWITGNRDSLIKHGTCPAP